MSSAPQGAAAVVSSGAGCRRLPFLQVGSAADEVYSASPTFTKYSWVIVPYYCIGDPLQLLFVLYIHYSCLRWQDPHKGSDEKRTILLLALSLARNLPC